MIRTFNKQGQVHSAEYVILIFIILGMIGTMSTYFQRVVQARHRDARKYMFNMIFDRTAGYYNEGFWIEYEPYYLFTGQDVTQDTKNRIELLPGGSTGLYRKHFNEKVRVVTKGVTAPPATPDPDIPATGTW